jgi:hypothetical protein
MAQSPDDLHRRPIRDQGGRRGPLASRRSDTAIEAARFLQQRQPGSEITVIDMRDGSVVPFDRP